MNIWLSREFAAPEWGEGALLSHRADGMVIHLVTASPLLDIQQAARRLCSQGIQQVCWPVTGSASSSGPLPKGCRPQGGGRTAVGHFIRGGSRGAGGALAVRTLGAGDDQCHAGTAGAAGAGGRSCCLHHRAGTGPDQSSHSQGEALQQAGWVGLYQVGRGSEREPVMLELDFNPSKDPKAPVAAALVGKGITFDSGGYSMKTSQGMLTMKHDMGGAASSPAPWRWPFCAASTSG